MTLTEQLDDLADESFNKLSPWVAANNHAILKAMLQTLANDASTVTIERCLDRSPDNDK